MGEKEGEEEEHLLKTFEEIQYLIEDLDNANSKDTNHDTAVQVRTLCLFICS